MARWLRSVDNATLHYTDALVNVVCGLTCLSLWLNQRRDTCLAFWACGLLIYGTLNFLFPFAPNTPVWNSFGFTILNFANISIWGGYRIFDGKRAFPPTQLVLVPIPLAVCILAGLLTGNWIAGANAALVSYCALGVLQIVYVVRGRTSLFGPRLISGLIILPNIVTLLLSTFPGNPWLAGDGGEALFLLSDHIVTIVFTLAVIAMVGERDYRTILQSAHRDHLTGALNRSGLADAISQGARLSALLLIDLDHFKAVNDRFGHEGGDLVLREFARRARGVIRSTDLLVRLGGEEFLIATDNPSAMDAGILAERACMAARHQPARIDGVSIPFTVSIGDAMRHTGEDLDRAIKRADAALYQAKAAGRDRISLADAHITMPGPGQHETGRAPPVRLADLARPERPLARFQHRDGGRPDRQRESRTCDGHKAARFGD